MDAARRKQVGRLLLELTIVFVGVLIALAADSWRSDREDAARGATLLGALQVDLEEADGRLGDVLGVTDSRLTALREFIEWLQSDLPTPEGMSLPDLRIEALAIPTGTLDLLASTSDMRLVTDEDLRNTIIRASAALKAAELERGRLQAATYAVNRGFAVPWQALRIQGVEGLPPEVVRASAELSGAYVQHFVLVQGDQPALTRMSESIESVRDAVSAAQR